MASNTFGFNMGPKVDGFGFYKSNSAPTPPTPQPKYIVVGFEAKPDGTALTEWCNINTTSANFTGVTNSTTPNNYYQINFDSAFATDTANVYIESYFDSNWYNEIDTSIPLFQITTNGTNIQISAPAYNQSYEFVNGKINILIRIFE